MAGAGRTSTARRTSGDVVLARFVGLGSVVIVSWPLSGRAELQVGDADEVVGGSGDGRPELVPSPADVA